MGAQGADMSPLDKTENEAELWANDYNMSGEYHLRLLTGRQYKGDPSHPQ